MQPSQSSSSQEKSSSQPFNARGELSIRCFSSSASSQNTTEHLGILFRTCESHVIASQTECFMNDLHVGISYERKITITNPSHFPVAFSLLTVPSSSYICSIFLPTNETPK